MANKWSRRRRVIKRPAVCRSKAKPNEPAEWPPLIKINITWTLLHDVTTLTSFGSEVEMPRIGTTNEYGAIVIDEQGNPCVISTFLGFKSSKTTTLVEITAGPAAGVQYAGLNEGWNGERMWHSTAESMICSDPLGIGTLEILVP